MKCIKMVNWGTERWRLVDSYHAENQMLCAGIREFKGSRLFLYIFRNCQKKHQNDTGHDKRRICSSQGTSLGFLDRHHDALPFQVFFTSELYGMSLEVASQVGGTPD